MQDANAVLHFDFCILHFVARIGCVAIARINRHLTVWVRLNVASGIAMSRSFDNESDFVLDTVKISPIIYIWYEGGWLSPPVVTAEWFV